MIKPIKELIPSTRRMDFYCTDCERLFSIYLRRGDTKPVNKQLACPHCHETEATEKYNPIKHGSVSGKYRSWKPSEKAKMLEMIKAGHSWADIGRALNRTKGAVNRRADAWGYKEYKPETTTRKRSVKLHSKKLSAKQIVEVMTDVRTHQQIADAYGVSRATISRTRKKGIEVLK